MNEQIVFSTLLLMSFYFSLVTLRGDRNVAGMVWLWSSVVFCLFLLECRVTKGFFLWFGNWLYIFGVKTLGDTEN